MMRVKKIIRRMVVVASVVIATCGTAWTDDSLRYANLGDFRLENGQTIRDGRLAFRTLGTLNPERSNAVLIPTWLAGNTEELMELGIISPGKMIDSTKYYIVAVDSFGNGVSSSPSNSSALQPGRDFPDSASGIWFGHSICF